MRTWERECLGERSKGTFPLSAHEYVPRTIYCLYRHWCIHVHTHPLDLKWILPHTAVGEVQQAKTRKREKQNFQPFCEKLNNTQWNTALSVCVHTTRGGWQTRSQGDSRATEHQHSRAGLMEGVGVLKYQNK